MKIPCFVDNPDGATMRLELAREKEEATEAASVHAGVQGGGASSGVADDSSSAPTRRPRLKQPSHKCEKLRFFLAFSRVARGATPERLRQSEEATRCTPRYH